jgi:hypothetical protein
MFSAEHLPHLPAARGPLTDRLFEAWQGGGDPGSPDHLVDEVDDPVTDEDLQLALYCCHELSYRGFAEVRDTVEALGSTDRWRRALNRRVEVHLRAVTADERRDPRTYLTDLAADRTGPSLSTFLLGARRREWFEEFLIHRSAYQLKEADPHSWAIPRLSGVPKAALVEIQADEYGQGVPGASHAELFADTLRAAGLDATYGAYLERLPAVTLATTNLISLLGSERRLTPALVGHLALFEMTSVDPMSRYAHLCDLLDLGADARRFYDVHVEADVHHGALALDKLVGGLVEQDASTASEITFGAAALSHVEGAFAGHLKACWRQGRSALRSADTSVGAAA